MIYINDMKELIGKTITGLRVNGDQTIIAFDHRGGSTAFETWGDCCSYTWFADITGVAALIGGTVLDAENIELDAIDDGRTRQEYDLFYGIKLRTNKGIVDIVYRNSSNGYYCGNIKPYAGVLPDMTEITDDWSA